MSNPYKPKLRDKRLWFQSLGTIGATAVLAIALNGALTGAQGASTPQTTTDHSAPAYGPVAAVLDTRG